MGCTVHVLKEFIRKGQSGEKPGMMKTGALVAQDGTKIFYRFILSQKSFATVILVHGFAEHSGGYEEIMAHLNYAHLNVLAFDLRGHGRSEGRRGYVTRFSHYLHDLSGVIEFVKERIPKQPIILMAHSMGALLAAHYTFAFPSKVRGLILSSPLFALQLKFPYYKQLVLRYFSYFWPSFSLPSGIEIRHLTHDEQKLALYQKDPLRFNYITSRLAHELDKAMAFLQQRSACFPSLPTFVQLAGDDKIVDSKAGELWCHQKGEKHCVVKTYPGFFHEIYQEIGREKPIHDARDWLLGTFKSSCHQAAV